MSTAKHWNPFKFDNTESIHKRWPAQPVASALSSSTAKSLFYKVFCAIDKLSLSCMIEGESSHHTAQKPL